MNVWTLLREYYNSNNLQTRVQHFNGWKIELINVLPFKDYYTPL